MRVVWSLQTEFAQRVAVVLFELHALHVRRGQVGPAISLGEGLIDRENWSAMSADVKGDAYEGLLERNAHDV